MLVKLRGENLDVSVRCVPTRFGLLQEPAAVRHLSIQAEKTIDILSRINPDALGQLRSSPSAAGLLSTQIETKQAARRSGGRCHVVAGFAHEKRFGMRLAVVNSPGTPRRQFDPHHPPSTAGFASPFQIERGPAGGAVSVQDLRMHAQGFCSGPRGSNGLWA